MITSQYYQAFRIKYWDHIHNSKSEIITIIHMAKIKYLESLKFGFYLIVFYKMGQYCTLHKSIYKV